MCNYRAHARACLHNVHSHCSPKMESPACVEKGLSRKIMDQTWCLGYVFSTNVFGFTMLLSLLFLLQPYGVYFSVPACSVPSLCHISSSAISSNLSQGLCFHPGFAPQLKPPRTTFCDTPVRVSRLWGHFLPLGFQSCFGLPTEKAEASTDFHNLIRKWACSCKCDYQQILQLHLRSYICTDRRMI